MERTAGFRALLSSARVYDLAQATIGSNAVRRALVEEFIEPFAGMRVLDLGCGPGNVRMLLDGVDLPFSYVGVDPSADYIDRARLRFPDDEFRVGALGQLRGVDFGEPFDRVIMKGVLHHLADDLCHQAAALAAEVLADDGRFVSIDPCFVAGQSRIARGLIERDRGTAVRTTEGYAAFFAPCFAQVDSHHRSDLLRVPYDHAVLVAHRSLP